MPNGSFKYTPLLRQAFTESKADVVILATFGGESSNGYEVMNTPGAVFDVAALLRAMADAIDKEKNVKNN